MLLVKALEEMVKRADEGAAIETAHFQEVLQEVGFLYEQLRKD